MWRPSSPPSLKLQLNQHLHWRPFLLRLFIPFIPSISPSRHLFIRCSNFSSLQVLTCAHTCTHSQVNLSVFLLLVPLDQRLTEVSEMTNDTLPHSLHPLLITHPLFLTASRSLFPLHLHLALPLSLPISVFHSLKLATFFALAPIKL